MFIVLVLHQIGHASSTSYPITNIDRNGVVTVTDLKSKQTFQFHVTDPKVLRSLKMGQLVYPDFPNQQVSLDGRTICCEMVKSPQLRTTIEPNRLPRPIEPSGLSPDAKLPSSVMPRPAPAVPGPIPPQ
jgi:hypothetical protein